MLLLIIVPFAFEDVYRLRVITSPSSGTRYMTRFYLRGTPRMADGTCPYGPHGAIRTEAHRANGIGLYLHKIHMSDDRPELHNHPWKWAYALVFGAATRKSASRPRVSYVAAFARDALFA